MNSFFDQSACENSAATDFSENLRRAIDALRQRLFDRHQPAFAGRSEDLQLALETAEAVAWCTPFPHLFLPDLAEQQIGLLTGVSAPAYALAA